MIPASAGLSSSQTTDLDSLMTATTLTNRNDLRLHPEITAFSGSKVVEGVQRKIDQEIEKYRESIRALQSRRNALSPIGRLPPEMLSRIFLFCSKPDSLAWIKEVSHVSRHWRAVALGCPGLWSFPVFSQPKWADEMLKRSKMAPLTIKADLPYMTPRMVDTVLSSLGQISRIGELEVKTGYRSVPEILDLTDTAPYLHSLCLASALGEQITLPNTFLNGEAPRLRKLELARFFIAWDSPLLSNLVHLKIQYSNSQARPSMQELIDALERMPLLESLELDGALPTIPPESSTLSVSSPRTALSNLKKLVIANASALECADVLNHLSFNGASAPSMKLSCLADNSTLTDFSYLVPALSHVIETAATTKSYRSLLVNIGFGGMTIKAWSSFVQTNEPPRSRPLLDLDFKWHNFIRHESEMLMAATCKSLPLRGLRALSLSTDIHEVETKTWTSTFGELPTLLTIRIHGQSTQLIAALREDVIVAGVKQIPPTPTIKPIVGRRASLRKPRVESIPGGGLFFPALRHLILEDTDFAEPVLDRLETALMERSNRQLEVCSLTLENCTRLRSEDVERLDNVCTDVKWDEQELGFTEDESELDDMSEYGDFDFYSRGFYFDGADGDDASDYDLYDYF